MDEILKNSVKCEKNDKLSEILERICKKSQILLK